MQLKSEEILSQKRLIFDLIENSIRKQSLSLLPGNTGRHSCRTKNSADVLEKSKVHKCRFISSKLFHKLQTSKQLFLEYVKPKVRYPNPNIPLFR